MPHRGSSTNVRRMPCCGGRRAGGPQAAYEVLERFGAGRKAPPKMVSGASFPAVNNNDGVARALAAVSADLVDGTSHFGVDPRGRLELQDDICVCRRIAQNHRVRHARYRCGAQTRRRVAIFGPRGGRARQQLDESTQLLSRAGQRFRVEIIGLGLGIGWLQLIGDRRACHANATPSRPRPHQWRRTGLAVGGGTRRGRLPAGLDR